MAIDHSEEFYAQFALVLQKAEELNLFILPNAPNKFGPRSLKRLDSLDTEAAPIHPSCAPLYSSQFSSKPVAIRVTLQSKNKKGHSVSKLAMIENFTMEELLLVASQKLSMKAKRVKTVKGEELTTNEQVKALCNDCVLVVS